MKKFVYFISILILILFVSACTKKVSLTVENEVNLYVGDEYTLNLKLENLSIDEVEVFVTTKRIIEYDNGQITALKQGFTTIEFSYFVEDEFFIEIVEVYVKLKPIINIENKFNTILVGKSIQLKYTVINFEGNVIFESDKPKVLNVDENGLIKALKTGEANIKIICDDITEILKISVIDDVEFNINIKNTGVVGEKLDLEISSNKELDSLVWTTNDNTKGVIEDGKLVLLDEGSVELTCDYYGIVKTVSISIVKDTENPNLYFSDANGEKDITISWGIDFNILDGVVALDNIDGDILNKVEMNPKFDSAKYGEQLITLSVKDSSGNEVSMERKITVEWNYSVQFIGHAGSFYGLMNSEEAFLYAVEVLKYQLVECDLKQTSDGVFVMCHDDTFGGYTLATTPWSVLKDVEVTKSRSSGIPATDGSIVKSEYTAKLCTLERYLEICKEYNAIAVIELKYSNGINNNDQSRMKALLQEIERCGMLNQVIFLGSQYNCLIWTRNNGYEYIPCQYLVNSCEAETVLQRCIDYNLDISIDIDGINGDDWLEKYKEHGIKISTYTFSQHVGYATVQQWIDKGVDYLTCDWHLMNKLNLPLKEEE